MGDKSRFFACVYRNHETISIMLLIVTRHVKCGFEMRRHDYRTNGVTVLIIIALWNDVWGAHGSLLSPLKNGPNPKISTILVKISKFDLKWTENYEISRFWRQNVALFNTP